MLNTFSRKLKKSIGIMSLTFFLCPLFSYLHTNLAQAAPPPPPPNQAEQPPPPKPADKPRPHANRPTQKHAPRPHPNPSKPAPRPHVNKPTPRHDIKPPMQRPKPSAPKHDFKPPTQKPKPPVPKHDFKPPMQKPKPSVPKHDFKPPMQKPKPPVPKHDFKPPMQKPKPSVPKHDFKPPIQKPKPPALKHDFKPPIQRPKPSAPKHDFKPPRKPINSVPKFKASSSPKVVVTHIAPPPPARYEYKEDKPSAWERILTGILLERMSFAKENSTLNSELNAIGFDCAGIDLDYPEKYVQIYCNNTNNNHIDYYLDKSSLKVLKYDPPYYTIKVNEIYINTAKPMDKKMNTWEFQYNIDTRNVVFKNLYGDYHYKYKNINQLEPYATETDIIAMAEMAFYMAYNMRFFDNQADSFYDVATL